MEWDINALIDLELPDRAKLPEWAKEDEAPAEVICRLGFSFETTIYPGVTWRIAEPTVV